MDKAFHQAAEFLAKEREMIPEDRFINLENFFLSIVNEHRAVWTLIWKAARRSGKEGLQARLTQAVTDLELALAGEVRAVGDRNRAINNTAAMAGVAQKRLERIQELERELATATGQLVARSKELADARQERSEKERNLTRQAQQRALELLRSNQTLRSQNKNLKALLTVEQLQRSRVDKELAEKEAEVARLLPLTTSGSKQVYDDRDRLSRMYDQVEAENRYHQNALDLAEQELSDTREKLLQEKQLRQQDADVAASLRSALENCMRKQDQLMTANAAMGQDNSDLRDQLVQEKVTPKVDEDNRCRASRGGHIHRCVDTHLFDRTTGPHACECGHRWYQSTNSK